MWNWGDGGRAQRPSRCVCDHIRERRNKQAEGRGGREEGPGLRKLFPSPSGPNTQVWETGAAGSSPFLPYLPEGAMVSEAWTRGRRTASLLWGSFPPFFTKLTFSSRALGLSLDWASWGGGGPTCSHPGASLALPSPQPPTELPQLEPFSGAAFHPWSPPPPVAPVIVVSGSGCGGWG